MATKRANEMGSVYKNVPRKRWQADLVVGHKPHPTRVDDTGRPVMVPIRKSFTGKTQKAVVARLDEAKGALEDGLEVPDNRATLADFTRWWMREVLPGEGLAPRTETWYGEMLESYVLPIVGAKTLTGAKALTPGDVEAMTAELGRRGLSPRVQIAARTTLGKVLRAAEVRGLVGRNVARLARPPKDRGRARAIKALTVDQLSTVLDAVADTRWRPMVLVAATTGLRPGELLALHWADLRLDGHEPHLSVRHALTHVGGASLKAPKRQRSHRTVPLAPAAVAALRAWKRAQATERLAAGPLWNAEWPDLIFTNEAGAPTRVDVFRGAVSRHLAKADALELRRWIDAGSRGPKPIPAPHVHPHMFRHTYATHLIEAGVPIAHVAELLGDTVAVVEVTYSHVLRPKYEVAAVVSTMLS